MFLEGLEFFSMLGFLKTDFKKKLLRIKKGGVAFLYQKKNKKVTINSNFTEFSRTPLWSESYDQRLKMSLEGLEFFFVLEFLKTDFKKKCELKKSLKR